MSQLYGLIFRPTPINFPRAKIQTKGYWLCLMVLAIGYWNLEKKMKLIIQYMECVGGAPKVS